jgi:hypothetical protein
MTTPHDDCPNKHVDINKQIDTKLDLCKASVYADIHEIREFVDKINTAFVKNDDGEHDYYGHHYDHKARIQAARAEKEFWETAKREALKGGMQWFFHGLKVLLILALAGLAVKSGGWLKFP